MIRRWVPSVLVAALAAAACGSGAAPVALPLGEVANVALPGRPTRFDYADTDAARHMLVVAHLGDSQVVAVDLQRHQVLWVAGNVDSVHGVRIVPALGRVFATATGTDQVVALDESSGAEVARAPTGRFPDGVAYDPSTNRILVSDKSGGTVTVLDAGTLAVVGHIGVGGDVGNVQTSAQGSFVAVGDGNELRQFDAAALTVTGTTALAGCEGAHGVALDPGSATAYVACENNASLVVVDLDDHRVTARLRVGDEPDVLALDPSGRRLYVAAESGTVTVVGLDPSPHVLGRARLASGAHTVAVDSGLGVVAFPLADVHGRPELRLDSAK